MMVKASLFVLGSFVVACTARVARFPQPGESLGADAFTMEPGGKGFNLAVGVHRLGMPVDGILPVGKDALAAVAASAVAAAGLPAAMLCPLPASTGGGVGFIAADGENALAVHSGANAVVAAEHARARAAAVRAAGLVAAPFEIGDAAIAEAFAIARAAGRTTLLNPSPFRMPGRELLADTTVLVVNRVEATRMAAALGLTAADPAGADPAAGLEGLAAAVMALGPRTLVVTSGNRGAAAWRAGHPVLRQPAFPVAAVDTLGAGDAFSAGLAAALLEERPFEEAVRRAAACGALVARTPGVFDALPTREVLEHFLAASR